MPCSDQSVVDLGKGFYMCRCSFACHGFGVDCVAVIVIEDEDIVSSLAGGEDELASLVRIGLSGDFVDSGKTCISGDIICFLSGADVIIMDWEEWQGPGFSFGGLDALTCLFHMAFGCGWGVWWIFFEGSRVEAREVNDKVSFESLGEGCNGGGKEGSMGKFYQFRWGCCISGGNFVCLLDQCLVDVPQVVSLMVAVTIQDGLSIVCYGAGCVSECCSAACITEEAN